MSKALISILALSAAACASTAASTARAADRDACRDYARAAVTQFHEAQEHRRCHDLVRRDPNRWHGDFRAHFDWCRAAGWDDLRRERAIRTRGLEECTRDHDDDRGHDRH